MTSIAKDPMSFHEKADTFDLSATLIDDKLILQLKDFVEQAVYYNEFTKQDIGGSIHSKMDLLDICSAFSPQKAQSEEKIKDNPKQLEKLNKYVFGQISLKKGVPCYKIQKGGKLTVYQVVIDKKTQTQSIYESNLPLIQVRQVTEIEINTQKFDMEMRLNTEQFTNQINALKKQNEKLIKQNGSLREKNTRLNEKITNAKMRAKSKKKLFKIKIQQVQNQLIQKQKELKNMRAQIEQIGWKSMFFNLFKPKIKPTSQKKQSISLKEQQHQFQHRFTESSDQQEQPELSENLSEQSEEDEEEQEQQQEQEEEEEEEQNKFPLDLFGAQQVTSEWFKIDGMKVKYKGQDERSTQYIFNYPINPRKLTKFRIKITQTSTGNMMIGVLDYNQRKDQRYSHLQPVALYYLGSDGTTQPQQFPKRQYGRKFEQDDVVQVEVDRVKGCLKYTINGVLLATQMSQILGDKKRIFMPFVQMCQRNNQVEWLLE